MNETSQRFLATIEALNVRDSELCRKIKNLSSGNLSNLRKGKNGVSMKVLSDLVKNYPKVSVRYILLGQGNMFLEGDFVFNIEHQTAMDMATINNGRDNVGCIDNDLIEENNKILKEIEEKDDLIAKITDRLIKV